MKINLKPFLLIYICVTSFLCNKAFSQHKTDSLSYYTRAIEKVTSEETLAKAYQYLIEHLEVKKKQNNKLGIAYDLYFLARIDYKVGFYDDSEVSAVEALKILDGLKVNDYNTKLKTGVLNLLGQVYNQKNMFDKANETYLKALSITSTSRDSMVLYNNISNIYKNQKLYSNAKNTLVKAIKLFNRVEDSIEKARVIDNLGFIKFKLNSQGAFNDLNTAYTIRQNVDNIAELYPSYKNLSEYYLSKKDTVQALSFAIKAYDVANKVNSLSYKLDAVKTRYTLGDNSVFKEYSFLNDSLLKAAKLSQNKFALLKYNVSKSQLESQIEKSQKQVYQLLAVVILILALGLLYFFRAKHKKEKLKEVYTTETRISKKVHDEVANDVYQIMTKLQSNDNVNEDVLDDLEQIYLKTRDISKENSTIHVNQDFEILLTDLLANYSSNQVNVITKDIVKVDWKKVSDVKKTALYRVLQELMTNMKKHSQANIVVVVFSQKNKKVTINYNDNGIGTTLKKHNGLQNVENRIQSVGGTITFTSTINKGFKANIIL
ncbi:tetratricopeptide repeat-containing sensor histidine kinase [Olleya marilimosa]|uniref:ATP-binding protein n=1 Tax=Olleya marilimosa TaxID=272164 RepID=A0ABR8LUL3_9FLAO|nr:ATP-binding protein [Olleya marilimosa]MBD3863871.1 ATP-binding protein [Olleya marilimosa]